jgi:hypothetical protein
MATSDVKFTTKEFRAVTKHLFLKGKRAEENHSDTCHIRRKEVLPTRQSKPRLLDLRQDIAALKTT